MNLVIEDGTNIDKNGMSEGFRGGRARGRPIAGGVGGVEDDMPEWLGPARQQR